MRKSLGIISTFLLVGFSVFGQQYNIKTVAGGAPLPNNSSAVNAPIGNPGAITSDQAGNIYFVTNDSVFRIDLNNGLTRVAGSSQLGFSGDFGAAIQAQLNNPLGVAIDTSNNLYIADTGNNRIRKVVIGTGFIYTVAGLSTAGYSGDNGPAANAALNGPQGLAVDSSGNLYIADTGNNVIRKINAGTGVITTVAGNGTAGSAGDGQPATSAQLNAPTGVAVDSIGNINIADSKSNKIRGVRSGAMFTIAGTGAPGYNGDNIVATSAQLNLPTAIAVDPSGSIYFVDSGNFRVREILQSNGQIVTLAGAAQGNATNPVGVTTDPQGNVIVSDTTRILKFTSGSASVIGGSTGVSYFLGDGGPATSAQLVQPEGMTVDSTGAVYVADRGEARVRKFVPGGNISSPPGATAIGPAAVALDLVGNLYIADAAGNQVKKISPGGAVAIVAGTGTIGSGGDFGQATAAQLYQPNGVAVDAAGNVYIADTGNNRLRKVTAATGIITTLAGNGAPGFQGDNGISTNAILNQPSGVAVDSALNIYIADTGNNRIRKILTSGIITTVAGSGSPSSSGDNGPAPSAGIVSPHSVAVDGLGNLYIPDYSGRVRKVSVSGLITTIAGNGTPGYSGDGGAALSAQLSQPWGVAVDSSGVVYVSDVGGQAVRALSPVAASPLSIVTASPLTQGTVGTPYAQALTAMGGSPPYSWSIAVGTLPAGLTLSSSGSITGTPTTVGSYLLTFQVTDSASVTAQSNIAIIIGSSSPTGLTITTPPNLPSGAVGIAYSQPLTAVAGNPPYFWTLVSGSLPVGLGLSQNGLISGTPVSAGTFTFTARVSDSANAISTATFTLQVISIGTLSRTGVLAHIAAGGTWTTKIYLTNISTSPLAVNLVIHDDNGNLLTLPMAITQQGSTQQVNTNSFNGVMNSNTAMVIDTGAQLPNTLTGWIDVLTSGSTNSLAGFAIFRTVAQNGTAQEGTTPLQTTFESKMDVPFDDTAGFVTGVAVANLSNSAATVTAIVLDQNGNQIGTYPLALQANGHTSFLFPSQFGVTANQQGLVQFVNSAGGNLGGVGLRASTTTGTFTSIPVIQP